MKYRQLQAIDTVNLGTCSVADELIVELKLLPVANPIPYRQGVIPARVET